MFFLIGEEEEDSGRSEMERQAEQKRRKVPSERGVTFLRVR
jgi:hypothetical protein